MKTTFPQLLLQHATQRPQSPALREKEYGIWQTHTWADLAQLVEKVAAGLHQAGLQRHEHMVVIGQGAGGTVQAAAQILASTNEQVAGINQVAIAMDNIRSASDQIVISMRQAEDATSSLNQMSSKLWSLIERFKVN